MEFAIVSGRNGKPISWMDDGRAALLDQNSPNKPEAGENWDCSIVRSAGSYLILNPISRIVRYELRRHWQNGVTSFLVAEVSGCKQLNSLPACIEIEVTEANEDHLLLEEVCVNPFIGEKMEVVRSFEYKHPIDLESIPLRFRELPSAAVFVREVEHLQKQFVLMIDRKDEILAGIPPVPIPDHISELKSLQYKRVRASWYNSLSFEQQFVLQIKHNDCPMHGKGVLCRQSEVWNKVNGYHEEVFIRITAKREVIPRV